MARLTIRMENALRNLRQHLLYEIEMDQAATYSGEGDEKAMVEHITEHCEAVRSVEAIDLIVGGVPPERNYDGLRWSASSAITRLKALKDDAFVDELLGGQAKQEGEI
jgi:hypothetical protein